MQILITGANGLLGQKLVELIPNHGHVLIATSKGANRNQKGHYTYAQLDITDRDAVLNCIEEHKPQVIINTAGMTNVDQCESEKEACTKLNVDAVAYLAEACSLNNVHLVHLSTDFIFDGEDGPYDENAQPNPLSFYGSSKLDGEKVLLSSDIKWSIARTVLVYGIVRQMSRSNIILWVKESLENEKHLKIVDDQWRTPTLAEDLAIGCLLIAEKSAEGVYNISGKDLLTPYDMALMTAEHFGLDASLITKADSTTFTQPAKRPAKTGFILDKAKQTLGYDPRSFKEGLAELGRQLALYS
ncbi:MAG: SDR family oxidoreductase [Cyclobacteriaceae bacterium]